MPRKARGQEDGVERQAVASSAPKVSTLRDAVTYIEFLRRPETQKTEAAALTQKTLTTMSHTIERIEKHLGVTLVERDPRAAEKVTEAGVKFIANAGRVIAAYDQLLNDTTYGLQKVRVGAYPSVISLFIGRRVFPRLFGSPVRGEAGHTDPTFPAQFPYHQLEVTHAGGRAKIIQRVEQRSLDFGIIDRDATQTDQEVAKGFRWISLFKSAPFGLLYPRALIHEGRDRKPVNPIPLSVLKERTLFLNEYDLPAVEKSGLDAPAAGVAIRCCVSSYGEVYEAVASGSGVGLGFVPRNAQPEGPVGFVPIAELACETGTERALLRRLEKRGESRFGVYVKENWKSDKGRLSDAAGFVLEHVLAARNNYLHDYVS